MHGVTSRGMKLPSSTSLLNEVLHVEGGRALRVPWPVDRRMSQGMFHFDATASVFYHGRTQSIARPPAFRDRKVEREDMMLSWDVGDANTPHVVRAGWRNSNLGEVRTPLWMTYELIYDYQIDQRASYICLL